MDITWVGHAAFRVRNSQAQLFMDPFDSSLGIKIPTALATADLVTTSNLSKEHGYISAITGSPAPVVLSQPGEYEISGLNLKGIRTKKGNEESEQEDWNTIFTLEMDGVSVCHLGNPGGRLTGKQIEELSSPQVLILPVGSKDGISSLDAVDLVNNISPKIIIPMMYAHEGNKSDLGPLSTFLQEVGLAKPEPVNRVTITKTSLPEEPTLVILTPAAN